MRETWYVLENGNVADPNECAPDESGKLLHKSGEAVAMRGQTPSSRSVDLDNLPKAPQSTAKDLKADDSKKTYKTRESKAG